MCIYHGITSIYTRKSLWEQHKARSSGDAFLAHRIRRFVANFLRICSHFRHTLHAYHMLPSLTVRESCFQAKCARIFVSSRPHRDKLHFPPLNRILTSLHPYFSSRSAREAPRHTTREEISATPGRQVSHNRHICAPLGMYSPYLLLCYIYSIRELPDTTFRWCDERECSWETLENAR